ncbi:M1 family metallopeptidase [Actinophytocola sp.]|uniref:M1 family metallopeptidase n=1 Tax=Actinophytocola sp. TaxID=1872138 RepID=UPI002D7F1A60|nr:M1 family metallopeptidase [Actinophytocola sp.]HET9140069.1 M1 family metallopeptidase [Actinophytocola sp.]
MAGQPDHRLALSVAGQRGYRVTHYDLDLDYRPNTARLAGRATISAVAGAVLPELVLDLGAFRIDRVSVAGRPARYTHRAGRLRVRPARPVAAGAEFTVEVRYVGTPQPVRSYWGEIGWDRLTDGALVASQPFGAPSWFPCNDDVADKAGYRISVSTASPYTVLANGVLVARKTGASTTTWVYEQAEPMSTYLASVHIGRYDLMELVGGAVPQIAAVPARLVADASHDFARQNEMMATFEQLFGAYPFARYSVVVVDEDLELPVEALGLSTFGANHVDGRRGAEHLVAHELAHQWFGNSLTVADWRHIWLNEGFAQYAEWLWSEVSGAASAHSLAQRSWAALSRQPHDLVLADPGVPQLFDDRVYQRGALTLHALRTTIGDRAFFALLRDWAGSYRHGTVRTEDFTTLAQRHTATPLDSLFESWLRQAPLPRLPRAVAR